jgi:hypothetical protein
VILMVAGSCVRKTGGADAVVAYVATDQERDPALHLLDTHREWPWHC